MLNKDRDIILIGGAPTSGKSTNARLVAKHLDVPWISTDQIRDIMRVSANKQDWPELFNAYDFTGESFLTTNSTGEIVKKEVAQGKEAWIGIKYFIENDYTFEDGFVMEGVNILPELVAKDFKNNSHVKSVYLTEENESKIRDIVFTRGVWADAHTYSDEVKEKEVDWILQYSHYLKVEAEKYDFPTITVKKNEEDLQLLLRALGLK
ncbi:MAG: hypothetical protein ACREHC_06835 [Candidatus Levyibacteriota bacterium]